MDELENILPKDLIKTSVVEAWNQKNSKDKETIGKKYNHLFKKSIIWNIDFVSLSEKQKFLLIKGELIRKYDSLSNKEKTIIKNRLKLSDFGSKWFKLNNADKHKLLNYVL